MQKLPQTALDVRLIALDLDDTLLDKNTIISDENVFVLQEAAKKGIYVVLCSGRAEDGILPFVRRLNIAGLETGRFLIAANGCSVFDMHKRLQIYSKNVENDVLLEADEIAKKYGLYSEVYSPDTIFYEKETEWTVKDVVLCGIKGKVIDGYQKFIAEGKFPKMLIPGEPETLQKIQEELKQKFKNRAEIFVSKPFFLEVLPPNCGKGEAILFLAEHLGLKKEQTMCFGDSMNDENMIVRCEYGVAMQNALDYIKTKARFVTEKTNNESGVADFIKKYVL